MESDNKKAMATKSKTAAAPPPEDDYQMGATATSHKNGNSKNTVR